MLPPKDHLHLVEAKNMISSDIPVISDHEEIYSKGTLITHRLSDPREFAAHTIVEIHNWFHRALIVFQIFQISVLHAHDHPGIPSLSTAAIFFFASLVISCCLSNSQPQDAVLRQLSNSTHVSAGRPRNSQKRVQLCAAWSQSWKQPISWKGSLAGRAAWHQYFNLPHAHHLRIMHKKSCTSSRSTKSYSQIQVPSKKWTWSHCPKGTCLKITQWGQITPCPWPAPSGIEPRSGCGGPGEIAQSTGMGNHPGNWMKKGDYLQNLLDFYFLNVYQIGW